MTTAETNQVAIEALPYRLHVGASLLAGYAPASCAFYVIPAQRLWDGAWELTADLLIEAATSEKEAAAVTLLTVQEYGVGTSLSDAVEDLLTSLRDYRQSLEAREGKLGAPAEEDLQALRALLRPATG